MFLISLLAFVFAVGALVLAHEWGHYRVARAFNVRVERFAIGFGRPLLRWRGRDQETEFVLAALPLGGYVKLLDERAGTVPPDLAARAFNRLPRGRRALVLLAGPAVNFVLGWLIFAAVAWLGETAPRALLPTPVPGSLAERAGLRAGLEAFYWCDAEGAPSQSEDEEGEESRAIRSFNDLQRQLTVLALAGRDACLLAGSHRASLQRFTLPLVSLHLDPAQNGNAAQAAGIGAPWMPARIAALVPGEVAERSGLKVGDTVLSIAGSPITDAAQLRYWIQAHGEVEQAWRIRRAEGGTEQEVTLTLRPAIQNGQGRIGAALGAVPQTQLVRYGFFAGFAQATVRVQDVTSMTLRVVQRLLAGEASRRNISGPLTIAVVAGHEASAGLVAYLGFLALLSVSLGLLNLFPIPALDGGQLLQLVLESPRYPWPERALTIWQGTGLALIAGLSLLALFNDFERLLGWAAH